MTPQWQFFQALARSSNKSPWMQANVRAAFQQAQAADEFRRSGDDPVDALIEQLMKRETDNGI